MQETARNGLRAIAGGVVVVGDRRPMSADDVIAEECARFARRLRRRAARMPPTDAAAVAALVGQLLALVAA